MENASKALIIAGAILLAILIIALGIYVFNMAKGATNTDQLDSVEKQTFNSTFTQYEGKALGSSVSELINAAITNASKNSEADDRLPDIIYLETRAGNSTVKDAVGSTNVEAYTNGEIYTGGSSKTTPKAIAEGLSMQSDIIADNSFAIDVRSSSNDVITTMSKLRKQMSAKHYYQVACHTDDKLGLVDFIIIKY